MHHVVPHLCIFWVGHVKQWKVRHKLQYVDQTPEEREPANKMLTATLPPIRIDDDFLAVSA